MNANTNTTDRTMNTSEIIAAAREEIIKSGMTARVDLIAAAVEAGICDGDRAVLGLGREVRIDGGDCVMVISGAEIKRFPVADMSDDQIALVLRVKGVQAGSR